MSMPTSQLRDRAPRVGSIAHDGRGWAIGRETKLTLGALVLAVVVGLAAARGGAGATLAKSAAVVALLGPILWLIGQRRPLAHRLRIEVPATLLLLSGVVLRQRDAESLAANPLDAAGLFRVVFVGAALLLGILALTERHVVRADAGRVTTRPFRIYALYVAVVFIGGPFSVNLPLTTYRGVELLAGLFVVAGAYRVAGREGALRIEKVVFWWLAAMLASVWIGVVLFPGEVLSKIDSPFPWQIHGAIPTLSSNGVGTFGVVLGIWSVAILAMRSETSPIPRRWLKWTAALGFVSLLFAQYRTGYVAAVLGMIVLLFLRANAGALAWVVLGLIVFASAYGTVVLDTIQPIALRGQTIDQASDLSSRTSWWAASIPVWRESPWIGNGLLTGTRFEVLAELGRTTTSTIHSTWVESLVGTGVIGTALLLSSALVTLTRGVGSALRGTRLVPAVVIVVLLVRSLTGASIEEFGSLTMLFLAFAIGARDRPEIATAGGDDGQRP